MNQKEQQAHATKLEQLEAATTEAIEAINEHLLLAEGRIREQGKSITAVASSEQQGRDLFAKMIDEETQYRKAHVRMIQNAIMEGIGKFTTGLTFRQRFRWLFLGRAFPLPPAGGVAVAEPPVHTSYYGEKPR